MSDLTGAGIELETFRTGSDGLTTTPIGHCFQIPTYVVIGNNLVRPYLRPEILNLFCTLYSLPIEKSIIYPQCNTFTVLILKIEVCFSLYFRKFTPSVGKIYPQGVNLPPVKNPALGARRGKPRCHAPLPFAL